MTVISELLFSQTRAYLYLVRHIAKYSSILRDRIHSTETCVGILFELGHLSDNFLSLHKFAVGNVRFPCSQKCKLNNWHRLNARDKHVKGYDNGVAPQVLQLASENDSDIGMMERVGQRRPIQDSSG